MLFCARLITFITYNRYSMKRKDCEINVFYESDRNYLVVGIGVDC